jgi:hypothetical protein
LIKPLLEE